MDELNKFTEAEADMEEIRRRWNCGEITKDEATEQVGMFCIVYDNGEDVWWSLELEEDGWFYLNENDEWVKEE